MVLNRRVYKWLYDHVHSHYYNFLIKWCTLPLGGEKRFRKKLLAPVEFSPGERIVDMACGTGGATFTIQAKAGEQSQVLGLDLSRGQLRVAKRHRELTPLPWVEADAAQAPFLDSSFDKVIIAHALHEMPRQARLQVLAEARRLLKQGGKVVVLELDQPDSLWLHLLVGLWLFYWVPFNFETPTRRDMLRHGVAEELRQAGFTQVTKESKYRGASQVVQGVK